MRPWLVAAAAGTVLTVVMSWPMAIRPGSVARVNTDDGRFSIWNVAWVAHALTDGSARLFDANIFHPHRGTLAYSEANLVAGVMAVPVYLATKDPIAAHNSVVLAALALSFVVMWALVRRLTRSDVAGLISGTGFAFCTYVSAHTAHIQLLMVFVVPLALLQIHCFAERPTTWRGVLLGLALALAGLACGYYGIFSGLVAGFALLWFAPGQPQLRYWSGVLVAVCVGATAIAPALRPYIELRRETGFKSAPNLDEARAWSASAGSYLLSGSLLHQTMLRAVPEPAQRAIREEVEVLFPGFAMLALAAVGVAARRQPKRPQATAPETRPPPRIVAFYVALTLLAVWVSLGPSAGLYAWLAEWIPMMSFLRAPGRAGIVAICALAVLGGIGAARLASRPRGALFGGVLVLLTAAELKAVWPLAVVPPVPAVYTRLASLPPGPVVELHFPYRPRDMHQHARYMLWSAWHWRPLVNGYSDFIPPDVQAIAAPINYFPDPESFRVMKARSVRYVIVHLGGYDAGPMREAMIARFTPYRAYLRLLFEAEDRRLYEIVAWPE